MQPDLEQPTTFSVAETQSKLEETERQLALAMQQLKDVQAYASGETAR